MKVKYLGINHRKGKSRKSGNDYDICELLHVVPTEGKTTDAYVYRGTGHEVRTFSANPDAIQEFAGLKPLEEVELRFEPQPDKPMRNWVCGIA